MYSIIIFFFFFSSALDIDVDQYSYAQLDSLIKLDIGKDTILKYCQLRLEKSISESDKEEQVRSYHILFHKNHSDIKCLDYIDQAILIADELDDPLLQFESYHRKAYGKLNFRNVKDLQFYLNKSKHFAKILEDDFFLAQVLGTEAMMFELLDSTHLALNNYKQSFQIYESAIQNGVRVNMYYYVDLLFRLSNAYNIISDSDSARKYANKGLPLAREFNFSFTEKLLLTALAIAEANDENYDHAIIELEKLIPKLKGYRGMYGGVIQFLIKSNLGIGDETRATELLEELEKLVAEEGESKNFLNDSYDYFFQYFDDLGDYKQALNIKKKKDKINTLLDEEWNELENDIITNQDNFTNTSNEFNYHYLYLIIGLVGIGIGYLIFNNKKHSIKKKEPGKEIEIRKSKDILASLDQFEMNKDYLANTSLSSLAKTCNTNNTYLSKIINEHKKKNFNKYINELRVLYFIENVESDTEKYRNLTISAIATDLGFKSSKTFGKAFKEQTGENPSDFLEKKLMP